jgi:hypothetical protein
MQPEAHVMINRIGGRKAFINLLLSAVSCAIQKRNGVIIHTALQKIPAALPCVRRARTCARLDIHGCGMPHAFTRVSVTRDTDPDARRKQKHKMRDAQRA